MYVVPAILALVDRFRDEEEEQETEEDPGAQGHQQVGLLVAELLDSRQHRPCHGYDQEEDRVQCEGRYRFHAAVFDGMLLKHSEYVNNNHGMTGDEVINVVPWGL